MADDFRRVDDWQGLTLQTGRRYVLNYETVDASVVPLGVVSETALGQALARREGVTVEGTNRGPFSGTTGVRIIWTGADLQVPSEAFPLRLQLRAEIAGSATVALDSIDVGSVVRPELREEAERRESDVVQQPGKVQTGTIGQQLLSPPVLVLLAVAFAFTGAGQAIVSRVTEG